MGTTFKAKILAGKKKFGAKFDKENEYLIVETTEKPDKGKANKEIVTELKKKFKAKALIVSGLKSRKKIIEIELPREQALRILETQN